MSPRVRYIGYRPPYRTIYITYSEKKKQIWTESATCEHVSVIMIINECTVMEKKTLTHCYNFVIQLSDFLYTVGSFKL